MGGDKERVSLLMKVWCLESGKDIVAADFFPLRAWGSQPHAESPVQNNRFKKGSPHSIGYWESIEIQSICVSYTIPGEGQPHCYNNSCESSL